MLLAVLVVLTSAAASLCFAFGLAGRGTPLAVPLTSAACLTFAAASVVLLPVDSTFREVIEHNQTAATELPPHGFLVAFWRALYWTTLALGWLVTETLCELLVAGEFSRSGRLRSALHASARLYMTVLVLSLCGLAYLLIWLHVSLAGLQSLAALLVNGHGVLVLALLQGQGMVDVPRRLWRTAAPRAALAQKYYALAAADDERRATASRLRALLHKVAAADAAAPPPANRGVRERLCWDALLRSARGAAAGCCLDEHDGGRLTWGLHAAWAHTLGTPKTTSEAGLAKLRRRVRLCGGVARRSYQRQQSHLHEAASLCKRLTANEKGFGGRGVGRSRGMWLGVMRQPCLRVVASISALLSLWFIANEACSTLRLLPAPRGHTLSSYCPGPSLDASLVRALPGLALLVQTLCISYAAICVMSCLHNSRVLASYPLVPWRRTDGVALLRHAAWSVRLAGPLASHFLLTAVYQPQTTALATALNGIWKERTPAVMASLDTMGIDSASARGEMGGAGVDQTLAFGATGFHGLCSLLVILSAGCSIAGMCGCRALLGLSTDPACRRYEGKPTHRSQAKRGERLARQYIASAGVLAAARCPLGANAFSCGQAGHRGLGAGLCASPAVGASAPLADSLMDDDDMDGDTDCEEGTMHSTSTPQPRHQGCGSLGPGSARACHDLPTPPSFAARAASAPGNMSDRRRSEGQRRPTRARNVWVRLVSGHEGGALSTDTDDGDGDDASSGDGSADDTSSAYHSSWPEWSMGLPRQAGSDALGRPSRQPAALSAKRVWEAIRSAHGGSSGGGSSSDGTGGGLTWCELTPRTAGTGTGEAQPREPLSADSAHARAEAAWRQLRAERA
jgi:hypothetical protein